MNGSRLPAPGSRPRVLLFATTTGYQTRVFGDAAARLGVDLVFATDRCEHLDDPWRDGAVAVRFHEEDRSVAEVMTAVARAPVHGVLAVGDRPTVMAARVARALGLPWHSPEAAAAARDKRLLKQRLGAAHLPVPWSMSVPVTSAAAGVWPQLAWPVVIKPTVLSGSRGVMRADDPVSFVTAFKRLQRLLASDEVRGLHEPEAGLIQIEAYVPGLEFALEGLMSHGALQTLAIFDKPDPLEGPFFEETIYVTPSRAGRDLQQAVDGAVSAAARAIGLWHGPIHAECRVNATGVYVLEVAARPIGGLCAQSLRFARGGNPSLGCARDTSGLPDTCSLEELLLRHALGEPVHDWTREPRASAVMMIPIPKAGVYRGVEGVDAATAVPAVDDVVITAKLDQRLVPIPEGASYLGFIFARAGTPAEAETAVRLAHARLRFAIGPWIPVMVSDA